MTKLTNDLHYCRIDQGSESCMDSLLANSARYAPNFDWVVADIGSAFPTEIINRVLRTGFKDFVKQLWGMSFRHTAESLTKQMLMY